MCHRHRWTPVGGRSARATWTHECCLGLDGQSSRRRRSDGSPHPPLYAAFAMPPIPWRLAPMTDVDPQTSAVDEQVHREMRVRPVELDLTQSPKSPGQRRMIGARSGHHFPDIARDPRRGSSHEEGYDRAILLQRGPQGRLGVVQDGLAVGHENPLEIPFQ